MNAASATLSVGNISDRQKMSRGEVLLLCCSVASLIVSCVIWSARKQAWMDEIFTWKEVSDRSFGICTMPSNMAPTVDNPFSTRRHGFGRKPSAPAFCRFACTLALAMCGALLVTWRSIRRFYGLRATAFGVLWMWGSSGLLLDQNAEGRFYGLFILAVAVAVDVYMRLAARSTPTRSLLLYSLLSQAALVLTHVLGLFYGGIILLALVLFDALEVDLESRYISFTLPGGWRFWSGPRRFAPPWRRASHMAGSWFPAFPGFLTRTFFGTTFRGFRWFSATPRTFYFKSAVTGSGGYPATDRSRSVFAVRKFLRCKTDHSHPHRRMLSF